MARRELDQRLRRLEDRARRRAATERPRPPARNEAVEWERTLQVIEALMECGAIPEPPPECAAEHDADGGSCERCEKWRQAVEGHVNSMDEARERRFLDLTQALAKAEEWPLTQATWAILNRDRSAWRLL
jgi:hypothetical protein